MQHIETVTVGSGGAASISFSAIAADWTDLYVVLSLRTARASNADNIEMKINSITTGYSLRALEGSGSGVSSFTDPNQPNVFHISATSANATASTFGNSSVYLPNYAGSTNKSYSVDAVSENNATQAFQRIAAGLLSNTAAISSLTFTPDTGTNFVQYSSASLYGITAGSDGIVSVS